MRKRTRSGFQNDAADKIWNDHIGNNPFVWHRDQCPICLEAYKTRSIRPPTWCPIGEHITDSGVFSRHFAKCPPCRAIYTTHLENNPPAWCPEGDRIFEQTLDEIDAQIDEARTGN